MLGRAREGLGDPGLGGCWEFHQGPGKGGCSGEAAGEGTPSVAPGLAPPRGQERGSASTVITVTGIGRDVLNPPCGWPGSLVVGCISHTASGKFLNLSEPQFALFKKVIIIPQTS